ncbi:cytochrome P450 [Micromonospora sp. CNB394]|uniref:cytochrome P450 n=1 Tax=Micromonospora sp. CNB394 TaxID=1169151 RepID=UPI0003800525|nr:cytochrome P450 [Micromonospora sp. CNB394]
MELSAATPRALVELGDIDLYDPAAYQTADQHATWRSLRQNAPVWFHDRPGATGFWCVTRHADCETVIKDHQTFSSQEGTILASVGVGDAAGGQTITLMDPPRHGTVRGPTMRALGHAVVRDRAPRIRERVRDLVAPCHDGEQDFARLMRRLPMIIAGELMGVPERYWDDIAIWAAACIAPDDPEYALASTPARTLRIAHHELFACFRELIQDRRRSPRQDLISVLISLDALDDREAPVQDWRILLNCYSFILGANTTTPHVASHTLLALVDRPDVWAQLTDPAAVAGLVEEGVRWTSPTHHLVRRVTADTSIGGVSIPEGDWVVAWVASANRDSAVFTDPFTFDIQRAPNRHLGFGGGPHYCVGAPSSRLALSILFEELAAAYTRFDRTGPLVHLQSNWINGLVSMPVQGIPRH